MRLLLDAHALLWWLAGDPTLSTPAREIIADGNNLVAVSAATSWEISIKRWLGTLEAPDDLVEQIHASHFLALPITFADGLAAGALPQHHDDPFDRMLVTQAMAGRLTVVTRDPLLARYDVDVLPA